jgi:hypothetical protein
VLEEIGIPPQIQMLQMYKQVVNIGSREVPEEIKNDPYLYRGFFCPNCNKAFCPQCSHMQGEICPECGQSGLMPAYRPLLKKIVQTQAKSTNESSAQQKSSSRKILVVVAIIGFVLCVFAGSGILYYRVGRPLMTPKTTVIFEPDRSLILMTVTQADLEETARILRLRWSSLGYGNPWTSFVVSDNGQIIGQIPTNIDTEFINRTKVNGLVEFVDFGKTPIADGTIVSTDFGYDYPKVDGTKWHTIMTSSEMRTISVSISQIGGYEILFSLTEKGKIILADYSTQNINSYLGIILDKVVISSPRVTSPIMDGNGVITGLTKQTAQIFAAIVRSGPLPIPLK